MILNFIKNVHIDFSSNADEDLNISEYIHDSILFGFGMSTLI